MINRQKDSLKLYIDMNIDLRRKVRNGFERDFLNLMNNLVFSKAMKNVTKHRYVKLVTTEKKTN